MCTVLVSKYPYSYVHCYFNGEGRSVQKCIIEDLQQKCNRCGEKAVGCCFFAHKRLTISHFLSSSHHRRVVSVVKTMATTEKIIPINKITRGKDNAKSNLRWATLFMGELRDGLTMVSLREDKDARTKA